MASWYVYQNNVQTGPVSEDQLSGMGLTPATLVWREGMEQWQPAGQVSELAFLFEVHAEEASSFTTTPPPSPGAEAYAGSRQYQNAPGGAQYQGAPGGQQYQNAPGAAYPPAGAYIPTSGKDKTTAGILAILLGFFGAQYFYLGKIGAAILTIVLSFVTCGIWNLLTFAQGIVMLTMSQEQFDRKYVYTNSTFPLF